MSRPTIAVVVPTITGREDHLERCLAAYRAQSGADVQVRLVVVRDKPTCGIAWTEGVEHIQRTIAEGYRKPDFLHLTADDLEPAPCALLAAVEASRNGDLPAPVVSTADGAVQSAGGGGDGELWTDSHDGRITPWCAIPFVSWEAWRFVGPMIPLHYYTDDWFSLQARRAGYRFRVTTDYAFTHYDAEVGRGAGMSQGERAFRDRADFRRYVEGTLTP